MRIEDAPYATLLYTQDRMDDEYRRTYYVRRSGEAKNPGFVNTYRVATEQGELWRG